ncbi:hypothetical protein ACPYPG_33895 [Streptomyces sp. FR-108]|uniref:hypothetical protein n=1 Tax=Streptomyces sp. FR-108 TaxID=3416665 RepID=UPI003CEB1E5A
MTQAALQCTNTRWWYGLAAARLNSAQAIVRSAAEPWTEIVRRAAHGGPPFPIADDVMISMMGRKSGRPAWSGAQDIPYRMAGSRAAVNGERMGSGFRDL